MSLKALNIEHQAILQAEQDEPGSEKPNRTNRIENFYIGDYTLEIFKNLRFYKRSKGKRAGHLVPIYVNPETGKAMKNPTQKYLSEVSKKLDNLKYTVSPIVVQHWKEHIKTEILKSQRQTVTQLRKEKEKIVK
ncbi:MAG TPA: hypothetical protein VEP90_03760 [Methylomirabilota bacterium]|nr:hypothetical protein [Methylomirabilota bacterium]